MMCGLRPLPHAPHTRRGLPCLTLVLVGSLISLTRSLQFRCAILANLLPVDLLPLCRCVVLPRFMGFAAGALEQEQASIANVPTTAMQVFCRKLLPRLQAVAPRALEVALALLTVVTNTSSTFCQLRRCILLFGLQNVTLRAVLQRAQLHAVAATPVLASALGQLFGGELTPL